MIKAPRKHPCMIPRLFHQLLENSWTTAAFKLSCGWLTQTWESLKMGTLGAQYSAIDYLRWVPILMNFCNIHSAAATAKSLQLCPALCDSIDGSPPGSPIPGILQPRTLEWVAISFSNAGKWKVKVKLLSRVRLIVTPWTAAHQAPLSMGFSRQEYWSGVPLPSPNVHSSTT